MVNDDPRAPYKVYEGEECKGTCPTRAEARRAQQRLASLHRIVISSSGTSWSASLYDHPRPKSAAVGWLSFWRSVPLLSTRPASPRGFFLGSCQRRALSFFHRGGLLNAGTGTRGTVARCIIGEAGIER